MRRDLDEVKPIFFGEFQPLGARDDSSLIPRIPDQPNGFGLDLGVDPIPFFRCDLGLLLNTDEYPSKAMKWNGLCKPSERLPPERSHS